MKGLECKMCGSGYSTKVRVVFKSKVVHVSESGIKAANWAVENLRTPCVLNYIYVCNKCGYEEFKCDRFCTDKL